jgi:hypothetical protein
MEIVMEMFGYYTKKIIIKNKGMHLNVSLNESKESTRF